MSLETAAQRLAQIAQQPINHFSSFDFGRQQNPNARSVIVDRDLARSILGKIRQELEPGLIAFIGTTRNLATNETKKAEIAIAESQSQFDILKIARTDGINYNLSTEDIITKLKSYDHLYGIDIFHAESDTIEFELDNIPKDLTAFCQDLYNFCPDIIDQGVGSIEQLEEAIMILNEVYLWWD